MVEDRDDVPPNAPQFVKEREAWFKAGANAMASIAFLATFLVGVIVSLATLITGFEAHIAIAATVLGTWVSLAIAHFYIEVTARRTAAHGGVQVERF
ncbi:hypothetical protein [Roseateles sp.]|uniref:hypothetical protein n=1 Tax=Roseateles sp. TaxID=1971397 RepID=UPI003D0F5C7B